MSTTAATQPPPSARSADQQPEPPAPPQPRVVVLGVLAALGLGGLVWSSSGPTTAALYAVGLAFGVVLFHARFGFTSAWRQLVAVRQGAGLRAHMLMLAVACTLFAPILATGLSFGGPTPSASLAPLGVGVVVGALLFGAGMQIGGACASGTLFAIGSGQSAIVLTLGGFIGGSVLGARTLGFWEDGLPAAEPVSLADTPAGYTGAWLISLTVIGAIVAATVLLQRRGTVPPIGRPPHAAGIARVLRGTWPLWVGALLLAGLNALTLLLRGAPWGITSAFALWGSKLLDLVGVDVTSWSYWQDNQASYEAGVLGDVTSVMDLGIILGALIATGLAGSWALHRRIPGRLALGAVIGGVLMGYGARIAYGCNIGAYFGGIASFSLHGWIWGVVALLGTFVGLKLRPLFGLGNPRATDSAC
ncbi:YeeE/YedE family protein [Nocardioides panacisoli]|uniref:YeeE/YedE family protein n=1 Tax=Nocardioides panacisoli TaxID=627624 RepID=UPI001C62E953|nr:YeeE/YedE family protein [Nocardioides panacisoli]QYJ05283.1 YeeE/YedE family protein [Nocardioides panacisoli]